MTVDSADEDDRRVKGWLQIFIEARDTGQWDAAVEAAEELDRLLRADVPAPVLAR